MSMKEFLELRKEQCKGPQKVQLDEIQREKLHYALNIGLFYYQYDSYFKESAQDLL